MKKPLITVLVITICILSGFVLGLFIGRNYNRTPVQIRVLPESTAVSETTVPTFDSDLSIQEEITIVNINTATLEQLQQLPGIGPVLAQRIIDYRDTYGPFSAVGELTKVDGIGNHRLEEILDYITIGG